MWFQFLIFFYKADQISVLCMHSLKKMLAFLDMYSFLSPQSHAEVTLAKADAALRQKENELTRLRSEHLALKGELTAAKNCLDALKERVQKLHEEGQVGIVNELCCHANVICWNV